MKSGILYVATGQRFVDEAAASCRSLRVQMPDIPVLLFTDVDRSRIPEIFDQIRRIERPTFSFADKIKPLAESPFERTIFLDTDTHVCAPLDDIFTLLTNGDIAAAHAPMRVTWPQPDIPDSFPEVNSGVLAWRKSDNTVKLFAEWERLYHSHVASTGQTDDQPAFRRALFECGVRMAILPPEYNFRTVMPTSAGRGKVKIIHGRHADMSRVECRLNKSLGCRVVLPGDREFAFDRLVVLSGGSRILLMPFQWLVGQWFRIQTTLTKIKRRWSWKKIGN